VHLIFLIGLRNRIQVFYQWVWAYLTYARGARLIYGPFKPAVAAQTRNPELAPKKLQPLVKSETLNP
jgi:NADH dehydrogenase